MTWDQNFIKIRKHVPVWKDVLYNLVWEIDMVQGYDAFQKELSMDHQPSKIIFYPGVIKK